MGIYHGISKLGGIALQSPSPRLDSCPLHPPGVAASVCLPGHDAVGQSPEPGRSRGSWSEPRWTHHVLGVLWCFGSCGYGHVTSELSNYVYIYISFYIFIYLFIYLFRYMIEYDIIYIYIIYSFIHLFIYLVIYIQYIYI